MKDMVTYIIQDKNEIYATVLKRKLKNSVFSLNFNDNKNIDLSLKKDENGFSINFNNKK